MVLVAFVGIVARRSSSSTLAGERVLRAALILGEHFRALIGMGYIRPYTAFMVGSALIRLVPRNMCSTLRYGRAERDRWVSLIIYFTLKTKIAPARPTSQ